MVHGVTDLDAAERFFTGALSMPVRDRGEGWTLVDNASVALRLVRCRRGNTPHSLRLELVGNDLAEMAGELLQWDGVYETRPVTWVSTWRQEQWLCAPFALELILARNYDEDELGIVPPLPTNLGWEPTALSVVQDLLRHVPVALREDARRQVTRDAENRALAEGRVVVERDEAVDVLVRRTPTFQHELLRSELTRLGLEPERWAESFARGVR
jgi:hypothetical protein